MTQQTTERHGGAVPARADSGHRTFLRWAGWSGLVASLAFLTTGVVANVTGVAEPDGPTEILRYLEEVSTAAWGPYTYGIAGIVLTVLYLPMAVGVHRLLARTPAAWFGTGSVVVGLAVLFPAYVIAILVPVGLVPVATETGGAGAVALYVMYSYVASGQFVLFVVGSVLSLGFGPLLWGYEWSRSMDSRRWLGWAGLITGVTGMVWFVSNATSPVVVAVIAVNVLVSLVFFTGVSLTLVSKGRATH